MNSSTTASTSAGPLSTVEEILQNASKLLSTRTESRWVLVAPDGRTWITSKPEELFAVLAPHHPLLKLPASDFVGVKP